MGWEWIVYAIILLIIVVALAPKPANDAAPAGLDKIQAPIAEEGAEIAVLFGTREMKGPNVVWFGDLETLPIQSSGGGK